MYIKRENNDDYLLSLRANRKEESVLSKKFNYIFTLFVQLQVTFNDNDTTYAVIMCMV